jgi:hypothetical protein
MSLLLKSTGGLILTAFALGIKKLHELRTVLKNLDFKLEKIYNIKIAVLENQATFQADFTVLNNSDIDLDVQTIGLVKLKRVLFYDQDKIIASANTNLTSINMDSGSSMALANIPFTTNLTGGIGKIKNYLTDRSNSTIKVMLEFEAFNKIYTTNI